MRVTLIHNRAAGDQAHSAKRILKQLSDAGHDATLAGEGKKERRKVVEDPGDLVVVAGGDGSIKRAAIALAGRGVPLAVLPIGTANNIAKSLGIIGSVSELIEAWASAERKRVSVCTVSTLSGDCDFIESVGVGVFTELVTRGQDEVDENTAGLTGHAIDRAILLLQRIVRERQPSPRALRIDGADHAGDYLLVEVMNMPLVGPNLPLAPEADFSDDLLDVVTVSASERPLLEEYLEARLSGGAAPPPLTVRRGRSVTMRAAALELHVDDSPWVSDDHAREDVEGDVTLSVGDSTLEVLVPSLRSG